MLDCFCCADALRCVPLQKKLLPAFWRMAPNMYRCEKLVKKYTTYWQNHLVSNETLPVVECISKSELNLFGCTFSALTVNSARLAIRGRPDGPGQLPAVQRLRPADGRQRHAGPLGLRCQGDGGGSPLPAQPHLQTQPLQRRLGHQHHQHVGRRHAGARG